MHFVIIFKIDFPAGIPSKKYHFYHVHNIAKIEKKTEIFPILEILYFFH